MSTVRILLSLELIETVHTYYSAIKRLEFILSNCFYFVSFNCCISFKLLKFRIRMFFYKNTKNGIRLLGKSFLSQLQINVSCYQRWQHCWYNNTALEWNCSGFDSI